MQNSSITQSKIPLPTIRPSLNYALKTISAYLHNNQSDTPKILDIGCGKHSTLGNYLRENNYNFILHGADMDNYALENETVDNIFICNAEDMPFADESYDIVFSHFLLEHIQDSEKALKEMSRILKNKGILVLVFPNPSSPESIVTKLTPYKFHIFFKQVIQKVENASKRTFPTFFSFKNITNIKNILNISSFEEIKAVYFPETFYRFSRRAILGRVALFYTKLLSNFKLDILKSSVVIVATKL